MTLSWVLPGRVLLNPWWFAPRISVVLVISVVSEISVNSALNSLFVAVQEPLLNAPFLNGLLSSGFSRGKPTPEDEIGETPH